MSNSITGTRDNSFVVHNPSQVSVIWHKLVSLPLLGFAMEDDAIQIEPDSPTVVYTKGLYGGTSANLNLNTIATVTLKLKASSDDHKRFCAWYNEMLSGIVIPADILIIGVDFKDSAFKCLPEKMPAVPRGTEQDPPISWILKAADVIIGEER